MEQSSDSVDALENYNILNERYRNYYIYKQAEKEESLIDLFRDNSKFLHSYLRKKKIGAPTVGPLRTSDGTTTSDAYSMAEIFAGIFAGVGVGVSSIYIG